MERKTVRMYLVKNLSFVRCDQGQIQEGNSQNKYFAPTPQPSEKYKILNLVLSFSKEKMLPTKSGICPWSRTLIALLLLVNPYIDPLESTAM